jgi:1-acyl-sn-glycerol-3-phosphate acyltransferase
MTITTWAVNATIKGLTHLACRIETEALSLVPPSGPLILVCNHINFMEVPLVYTHLQPRPVTGYAKSETWDNPLLRPLFNLWGAIPLRRGEADLAAIRKGIQALQSGKIVAISPEGTRSCDGRLGRGIPGVVLLALNSGAPLLPMVYYGSESLRPNLLRLRRTDFHIRVGQPFYLDSHGLKTTREVRQVMVDEIMCQLAALLPLEYRGVYANFDLTAQQYLRFETVRTGTGVPDMSQ